MTLPRTVADVLSEYVVFEVQTVICGPLADQPALHGLLVKIRDLGLCLISVRRLDSGDAGDGAPL